MHLYFHLFLCVLAIVSASAGCSCRDGKPEAQPPLQSEPGSSSEAALAVAEFKKILAEVESRTPRPLKYVQRIPEARFGEYSTGGKWMRFELEYSIQEYDVTRTDSLITPFKGFIQASFKRKSFIDVKADDREGNPDKPDFWFDSEAEAMASTKFESRLAKDFELESRLLQDYEWRDGKWIATGIFGQFFPFSDEHFEFFRSERDEDGVYRHEFETPVGTSVTIKKAYD